MTPAPGPVQPSDDRVRSAHRSPTNESLLSLYLAESRALRLTTFTAMYFAQGVPIGLLTIALPAWLIEQGAGIDEVAALTAFISLPWGFKLIAGPFMDRFRFPPMGFRRPWVMGAQAGLTLALPRARRKTAKTDWPSRLSMCLVSADGA